MANPPDSGEREVLPEAQVMYWRHHVAIPTDLAQRILAALEMELANAQDEGAASYWHALASELRAIVERKP